MNMRTILCCGLLGLLLFGSSACALVRITPAPVATPDVSLIYTQAAGTIMAELAHAAAETVTHQPSATPAPTVTSPATKAPATPTSTLPPVGGELPLAASASATFAVAPSSTGTAANTASIKAKSSTNCRLGPGKDFNVAAFFLVGQSFPVLGRNADSSWWLIPNPDIAGKQCWVWSGSTEVTGDLAGIPQLAASLTPTP